MIPTIDFYEMNEHILDDINNECSKEYTKDDMLDDMPDDMSWKKNKKIIRVGRTHCQFFQDDSGRFCVQDLDSPDGTFVNGMRCDQTTQLHSTDIVRIGNTTLPWQTYFDNTETEERGGMTMSAKPVRSLLRMEELIKMDTSTTVVSRIKKCMERITNKVTERRKH